jgi:hypothetical protein
MSEITGKYTFQRILEEYKHKNPDWPLSSSDDKTLFLNPACDPGGWSGSGVWGIWDSPELWGGANVVKRAIAEQYGLQLAESVFQNVGARIGRPIDREILCGDLDEIDREIKEEITLSREGPISPRLGELAQEALKALASGTQLTPAAIARVGQYVFGSMAGHEVALCLHGTDVPSELEQIILGKMMQISELRARTEEALNATNEVLSLAKLRDKNCSLISESPAVRDDLYQHYGELMQEHRAKIDSFLSLANDNPSVPKGLVQAIKDAVARTESGQR